jgi:hypothetical protein
VAANNFAKMTKAIRHLVEPLVRRFLFCFFIVAFIAAVQTKRGSASGK